MKRFIFILVIIFPFFANGQTLVPKRQIEPFVIDTTEQDINKPNWDEYIRRFSSPAYSITNGYVPYFNGTTLATSQIYRHSSGIGIGLGGGEYPIGMLDVNGNIYIRGVPDHPNYAARIADVRSIVSDSLSLFSGGDIDLSNYVTKTGTDTISGTKRFTSDLNIYKDSPYYTALITNETSNGAGLYLSKPGEPGVYQSGFNSNLGLLYTWSFGNYDYWIGLNNTELFRFKKGGSFSLKEIASSPATPASGFADVYAKSDGRLYFKNSSGTEYNLTSQGYWSNVSFGITYSNNIGVGANPLANAKIYSYSNDNGVWAGYFRNDYTGGYGLYVRAAASTDYTLRLLDNGATDLFNVRGSGAIYAPSLGTGTDSNVLYYNTSTGLITYGATPSGSGDALWTSGTGYISPATSTDEVRIGGTSDSGDYKLQVIGHSYFAGSVNTGSYVQIYEIAAPATPSSGWGRMYAKTDGKIYFKNDGGTEYDLTAGVGEGSGTVTSVGVSSSDFSVSGSPVTTSGSITLNLGNSAISNQTALTSGLVYTDELLVSDAGVLKRMDVQVIEDYMKREVTLSNNATSMNYRTAPKVNLTLTTAVADFVIQNLPEGGEGQIDLTSNGNTFNIAGDTGYTTLKRMGEKTDINSGGKTTIVFWRTGSTLNYGYIHEN